MLAQSRIEPCTLAAGRRVDGAQDALKTLVLVCHRCLDEKRRDAQRILDEQQCCAKIL